MKDYKGQNVNEEVFIKSSKNAEKNEYSTDKNIIENHCIDWRGKYKGSSDIIFFPKSVSSIIKIVKFCFKEIFQLFLKVETQVLLVGQFLG